MTITTMNKLTNEDCNNAFAELPLKEKQWLFAIMAELKSARHKHPEWPFDVVHRAAVIGKENGELTQAALQVVYENGPWEKMHIEAIQTASTCLRFLSETNIDEKEYRKEVKQAKCEHDYKEVGEGHNKKYYRCAKCQHETWG